MFRRKPIDSQFEEQVRIQIKAGVMEDGNHAIVMEFSREDDDFTLCMPAESVEAFAHNLLDVVARVREEIAKEGRQ